MRTILISTWLTLTYRSMIKKQILASIAKVEAGLYKKIIRGINVYPDWGEVAQSKFKLDEISVDWSKRITKDGQYLGVTGGYNFDRAQGKVGLRYSF